MKNNAESRQPTNFVAGLSAALAGAGPRLRDRVRDRVRAWGLPRRDASPSATDALPRTLFRPVQQVDYRDRISVVTWLLVFGLGLSVLVDVPTRIISLNMLGSPVSMAIGDTVLAALFLAVVAAGGTQSVLSVHPAFAPEREEKRRTWAFWALPMALTIIAVLLLPLATNRLLQVGTMLLGGALVALALFCLYTTVERGQPGYRRARFVLNALAYGAALLLFLFVYQTRTRSLLSGTFVALTAMLLAVEVLRSARIRTGVIISHGAVIGLVLGQMTWALNYWRGLPELTASLLLLLIFYLFVGIGQQGLQRQLTRRVIWEFVVFGVVALLLIAVVGQGFT